MLASGQGSIRLFKLFGINVLLHWSWFVVALWAVQNRTTSYNSAIWNVFEYLGLFAIVLMHEFGHSLACRQVGGKAEQIILWPLGGVAYVNPPNRPGAHLWSIAAGPLVNLVIGAVMWSVYQLLKDSPSFEEWAEVTAPDTFTCLVTLFYINAGLFIFNMLPVYPLDGGQILRSLLWFVCGAGKSLLIASVIGFIGVAALGFYAFQQGSFWLGILTFFVGSRCIQGWKQAQAMMRIEKMERWKQFACPNCGESPLVGNFLKCSDCETAYDPFLNRSICPQCHFDPEAAPCIFCGTVSEFTAWEKKD